ncbi:FecCD family ABC transporter permease [Corynebacterium kroppenstedtii]|uniref:FecCD family ABC transporter permease n=1 Tax=Corynebacterium sp. PCR 32 TaxID=3351342 RepID=UPI0030AA9EF1
MTGMRARMGHVLGRRSAFRWGPVSGVVSPRPLLVCAVLVVAGVFLFAVAIGIGDFPIAPLDVLSVVFTGGGTRLEQLVVFEWRMPRALSAVMVGAALALSGALTQSVTRNALASPDLLGVTSGASAGAVTVIVLGSGTGFAGWLAGAGIPAAALMGAFGTAMVMWLIGFRGRQMDIYRVVLLGIVVTALLTSYIHFLMIRAERSDAAHAKFWLTGSLSAVSWERVRPLMVVLAVCVVLCVWISFELRASELGPDVASSLGQSRRLVESAILAMSVVLAACAVSAGGPIGFVAFVAPQVAMRLAGTTSPPLFTSLLTGSVLLLVADIATQTVLPTELPVGLITSAVGGVFLIYLLVRTSRKATI